MIKKETIEKNIPNIVTISRMFLSFTLLYLEPLSFRFFIIYAICGISDMFDGYLARKKNLSSKIGATLDSLADFIFIAIMLFILLSILNIPFWALIWIFCIVIIRMLSLLIGFIKYKNIAFLHTYLNKFTGALLFGFPFLYVIFGMTITICLLSLVASISAIEELVINVISKELLKDRKFIFKI